MSNIFSGLVWEYAPYTGTRKLVLLALADEASPEGTCWPRIKHLAKICGCDGRSIQRHLTALINDGWVRRIARPNRSNFYQIHRPAVQIRENYPLIPENQTPDTSVTTPLTPVSPPPDTSVTPPLTPVSPRTINRTSSEPKEEPSSRLPKVSIYQTSLAQRADNPPPTVTAPPERRTRERLNVAALKRDPLVVTLIACFGVEPATPHEWDSWRIAVNDLHTAGATSNDIPRAIKAYQSLHPTGRVTPMALARNWSQIREGKSHELAQLEIQRRSSQAVHDADAERQRAQDARRDAERAEVDRLMAKWGYGARAGEPPRG